MTILLPLVWVVDTSSCGDHVGPVERTGLDVVRQLDFAWWEVAPVLAAMVLAPWVASRVVGVVRIAVHVVGLVVTGLVGVTVFAAFFVEIFTERTMKGFGFVVVAAGASAVGDALFRVGAGGHELWKARRAARAVGEATRS